MKEPFIYGQVSLEDLAAKEYDVFKAAESEDILPTYAVINRRTGVVEFTTENASFALDWLAHFTGDKREAEPNFEALVAQSAKAN